MACKIRMASMGCFVEIPKIFRKRNTVKDRQISVENVFQLKRCQVSDLVSQQRSLQIDPGLFDRHSSHPWDIISTDWSVYWVCTFIKVNLVLVAAACDQAKCQKPMGLFLYRPQNKSHSYSLGLLWCGRFNGFKIIAAQRSWAGIKQRRKKRRGSEKGFCCQIKFRKKSLANLEYESPNLRLPIGNVEGPRNSDCKRWAAS